MQLHNIKRVHKRKIGNFVGRGGKRGKTSGRGTKGQKARAGRKIRPEFRDVIMRMPKLRGRGTNTFVSIERTIAEVKIGDVNKKLKEGVIVSPSTLYSAGLITKGQVRFSNVKIIGGGELSRKIEVSNCSVSAPVKALIEKNGGAVLEAKKDVKEVKKADNVKKVKSDVKPVKESSKAKKSKK